MKSIGAECILIQGRLSDKSFRGYYKIKFFTGKILKFFDHLATQNQDSAEKFIALGVSPHKVKVAGNSKFDGLHSLEESERKQLQENLSLKPNLLVFVAGSTHEGEEKIVLDAFRIMKKSHPMLMLIIAPRRLERLNIIENLLNSSGISFLKQSEVLTRHKDNPSVILVDRMGELPRLYSIASFAFVGNSLVPPGGGHSLLEPVAQGVPVMHGPHIGNHEETGNALVECGIGFGVKQAKDIASVGSSILSNPEIAVKAKKRGREWIASKQGVSNMLAETILYRLNISK